VTDRLRFEAARGCASSTAPPSGIPRWRPRSSCRCNYNPRTIAWAQQFRSSLPGADADALARA
jgi:hypothetical protein